MSETPEQTIRDICRECGNDGGRTMDIVRAVQQKLGRVSGEAMDLIAEAVGLRRVEVQSVVSFYAFLSEEPTGQVVIRLCNDVVDRMQGSGRVAKAFAEELGIEFGQTTADGKITLTQAPCIGMCDQGPAALINDVVIPWLSSDDARRIVGELREHMDPHKLVHKLGDGNNADPRIGSMVVNNIRKSGPVFFGSNAPGAAIGKAIAMSPSEVIRDINTARLRGRGGAGFPTGMKWQFTRAADGDRKFVLCNADEGEPGTFKDRVLLTESPHTVFEGMTIAGYAIGAAEGVVYLRAEYAYLRAFLESILEERREEGLLGTNVAGKDGFDFDIRIQMGAGAYICGEETALISSCEGKRGDPKNRPPFPAQKGYQGCPTTVNNVETFCVVTRILEEGPGWFAQFGSKGSPGTKLLSVSGDCSRPGVYEVPFGIPLREVLEMVGGSDAQAVQVGGPSGQMVGPDLYDRTICYDDLATGGAIVVFGAKRNLLKIAAQYMEFFIEESCGYCTPCRVGNVLLKERLDNIIAGKGQPEDLDYLEELGATVRTGSRCGLGQTSAHPVLSTLKNFRSLYEGLVQERTDGLQPSFDIRAALADAEAATGRQSVHFQA